MNIAGFLAFILTAFAAALAGVLFLATNRPRVDRFRGVYSRICVQLAPDQCARYPDARFDAFKHLIRSNVDALTAVEFLDDVDPQQSVLDRVGAVSPSLFLSPVANLMGLAHILALALGPLFLATACQVPPLSTFIVAQTKTGIGGIAFLVAAAATGGVLLSYVGSMIVWRVSFERDLAATIFQVESELLWSVGKERRPDRRNVVLPKDDLGFSSLKGK